MVLRVPQAPKLWSVNVSSGTSLHRAGTGPVNPIKELPGVKKYEVVYPRRLHPLDKREIKEPDKQDKFETELKYEMTVNGKIAVLYLKKNKDLLAPGYTETYYNSTGKEVTTSPQIMDDCYYQGHLVNENVSDASISTCRGLRATGFSGTTVGLAFMSTMCSPYHSVGIIQDHSDNVLRVAGTMAHEMGHNFGMFHNSKLCKCPSTNCVMDRALSFYIPSDFSSCSRASYEKFFEDKLSNCLFNAPLPRNIISLPVCGNQLLETGEECDCGTPEFKKAGAVCRPAKDECDLPEMCVGNTGLCPDDRFRVNGFPCQNGKGYCLLGMCPTLQEQCTDLWGPGTQVADKSCFRTNEGGSKYGYCRRVNNTHLPCKAKDAMCGKLFCQGGSDSMFWKGDIITFKTCKTFDSEDINQELGMVAKGTKCGDNKVCINAECVDVERAYKSANCSWKCKGHAVCDHELQCQCQEGWMPPDCDGSSARLVFNFSVVVGVLFPVAVIFVVVAIVMRHQSTRGKQNKVQRQVFFLLRGPPFGL
ncbi:hypothetical protein CB1_002524001 [Camelus ferus]|nr:hypothetical protein CB1_002524001 [Camelus ferus]